MVGYIVFNIYALYLLAKTVFESRLKTCFSDAGCLWDGSWLVGCLILNVPVNSFSVMLGRSDRFLDVTSTFWGSLFLFWFLFNVPVNNFSVMLRRSKCALLKDTTRFDPSDARTPDLFFFDSVYRPFQDYFTHRDWPIGIGGAKLEYPGKTT